MMLGNLSVLFCNVISVPVYNYNNIKNKNGCFSGPPCKKATRGQSSALTTFRDFSSQKVSPIVTY